MKKYRHQAYCLVCNHSDLVFYDGKEDYQEVRVCPKCNGAFVDMWKVAKYEKKSKLSDVTVNVSVRIDEKQIDKAAEVFGEAIKNAISISIGR